MRTLLYLITIIIFTSSCTHLLEEEMYSEVTDNYLNTPEGFEDGVAACYTPLRSFYASEGGFSMTVFGTDTYTMGRDGGWKAFNTYTGQLNPSATILCDVWRDFYRGINTCNAIIDRAPDVDLPEDRKRQLVNEARFLRAHYYFVLVQLFGPVHLSLHEVSGVAITASRTPIADVYQAIVADLEACVQQLEVKSTDYGRATKPAAEHLLARVLLTRATTSAKESDDYERAAQLATHIINDYDFRLLDNFGDVFAIAPDDRSDEIIWAVQYTADQRANGNGNRGHFFFVMDYRTLSLGVVNNILDGRPWTRFRPTEFTLETLFADRVNDVRYEQQFQSVYYCNNPGTYTLKNGKTVTLALGDTAIWLPGHPVPAADANRRNYEVLTPDRYSTEWYPTLIKYLDANLPTLSENRGTRDFLAFRLAETYLIAAEALYYTGDHTNAVNYLNTLRERSARVGTTDAETAAHKAAMHITEDQLDIDFILDERGRELLGEQFRWFDLVRTGKLLERVKAHNPDAAANIRDFHVLRPIPLEQIDRTEGGTDAFPQNTGY